jgi:hypothetical protein
MATIQRVGSSLSPARAADAVSVSCTTRILLSAALVFALALAAVGSVRAEIVVRGIHEGTLALGSKGTPFVAYVRGTSVVIATRVSKGRWRAAKAGSVSAGSRVMAFKVGAKGPVALVQSADDRTLVLVRRHASGWQRIRLAGGLPASIQLGWPGLALGGGGLPVVGYTRWNEATLNSQLVLARVDARGRVRNEAITAEGFPQSFAPPPAVPVFVRGRVHVVQSFGFGGWAGTIEWLRERGTWSGLFIDFVLADYPVGPLLAVSSSPGTVYAAWSLSMFAFQATPVTLAVRGSESRAEFVLDRALVTALTLPRSGPEIAANEWVAADELGLEGDERVWAGMVVRGMSRVQLDGSIEGFAVTPRGGRDLLLAQPAGLYWFRSPRGLATRMSIEASARPDGSVSISGQISDVNSGKITLYRERPGKGRSAVGRPSLVNGAFSFVDRPPVRPLLYRAVYTEPKSGIPYAALLRTPVS